MISGNNQGVIMGGILTAGVLIYAAISDSSIWDTIFGTPNPLDFREGAGPNVDNQQGTYSDSVAPTGARQAVVDAAVSGLKIKSGYAEVRPMPASLAACERGAQSDCSGFATLCYKQAGAPDPNGLHYNGYGYTGTLLQHGKKTNTPQPGDLHFWNGPAHVCVDVGGGKVIGWGGSPGPSEDTVSEESRHHSAYLGARTYLPLQTGSTNLQTGNNPRGTRIG